METLKYILVISIMFLISCDDGTNCEVVYARNSTKIVEQIEASFKELEYDERLKLYELKANKALKSKFYFKNFSLTLNKKTSHWISNKNRKGDIQKISSEIPNRVLLRYSIMLDSIEVSTPIGVEFDELMIPIVYNIESYNKYSFFGDKKYIIRSSSKDINRVIKENGFDVDNLDACANGIDEIKFVYIEEDSTFYWTKIRVDSPKNYEEFKSGTCEGEQLYINSENESIKTENYFMIRVFNQ